MLPADSRPVREASNLADAFERMLDRGIVVIDAEHGLRIASPAGASVEARIVVVGIETYVQYEAVAYAAPLTWLADRRVRKTGAPPRVDSGWKPTNRLRLFFRDFESDLS